MAFMDDMREKLSRAGQSTMQKAKDISEVAKLKSAISADEDKINDLYGKIGYEIYCVYADHPLPEVAELIGQVAELHKAIEENKKQIEAINAASLCPQCGAKISKGMAFCSNCGCKLAVPEKPAEEATRFCSSCGAAIPADSLFCPSCGSRVE